MRSSVGNSAKTKRYDVLRFKAESLKPGPRFSHKLLLGGKKTRKDPSICVRESVHSDQKTLFEFIKS